MIDIKVLRGVAAAMLEDTPETDKTKSLEDAYLAGQRSILEWMINEIDNH